MENREALLTEKDSFENMHKAFIAFRDSITDQMETIRAAGEVLYEEMGGDDVSKKYLNDLGGVFGKMRSIVRSVDNAISMIEDRIRRIDEILENM